MKFSRLLTLFLLFFTLFSTTFAQELPRKGTFGIQMEANQTGKGLTVLRVFPNTTAANIGMEEGDILLTTNGESYDDVFALVGAIGEWKAGDPVKVTVDRQGKTKTLKGTIVGKPLETSEVGEVIYGAVEYDGGQLRSILELPKGVENPPVVFFLPGVGCGSLDYYYNPGAPVKMLTEELVSKGIAVYRVEKPGMGDSQGTIPCEEMDFNYEVAAFSKALTTLKSIEEINADQVFLYGHSLGVISAPLVAQESQVAGIIAWGGIAESWFEYSIRILKDQKVLFGQDYVEIEQEYRELIPFYVEFLLNKKTPDELKQNEAYTELIKSSFEGDRWYGLQHYRYFQVLNDVDILTAYKEANCPVLALAGEYDIHAIDTKWASDIAQAVNYYRPNQGESQVIAGTTHHYHTVPSIKAYNEMRSDGSLTPEYITSHFNSDIADAVSGWIQQRRIVGKG